MQLWSICDVISTRYGVTLLLVLLCLHQCQRAEAMFRRHGKLVELSVDRTCFGVWSVLVVLKAE